MNEKRVAIVTGGSRGIGAAIVRRLAKDGLHVLAVARNQDKLRQVCDAVRGHGSRRRTHPAADICSRSNSRG